MAIASRITPRIGHGGVRNLHTFQAFHNRDYRRLWPANFFSYVARWMQMTLLFLLVLDLTDSPFKVALVGFFGMVPMLLLGVFGGVLADRLNRKRLLVATSTINLAAVVAMTLILQTDSVQYWYAYVIILVSGLGWALDMPSRRSLMADIVGRSGVTNAIALDSVGMHTSKMIGPLFAGALITFVGIEGGYAVISAFYFIGLLLIIALRTSDNAYDDMPARQPAKASGGVLSNLVEGFRYVRKDAIIMAVIVVTVLMNVLLFSYMQMIVVISRDVLGVGPALTGLLMSADGLGALTGAVLIATSGSISHQGRIYFGGSMFALVMLLLFSFSQWYALSLPLMILLGLGSAGFGTMQGTIVMLVARQEMRGRALGVISLAIGAGPLGALMVGAVASATSPAFSIGLNAVLGIITMAMVGVLMPQLISQRIEPDETEEQDAEEFDDDSQPLKSISPCCQLQLQQQSQ